ncbi:MAG: hypothetical protein ACOX5R_06220 [bacterium]
MPGVFRSRRFGRGQPRPLDAGAGNEDDMREGIPGTGDLSDEFRVLLSGVYVWN